jgi:hypothetical protein
LALGHGKGFLQHLLGFLQRPADRGFIQRLAGEAGGIDMRVGADDHHVGGGNFFFRQRILGADRALGFHLDLVTVLRRDFLQRLGGHEGMRDAGRAGGDGDDLFHPADWHGWLSNRWCYGLRRDADQRQRRFDHRLGVADRRAGAGFIYLLAGEAGQFDMRVGGQDDHVGGGQFSVAQHVLGAGRALGFDADGVTHDGRFSSVLPPPYRYARCRWGRR